MRNTILTTCPFLLLLLDLREETKQAGDLLGTISWWLIWDSQLVIELGQSNGDPVGSQLVIQLGQWASDSVGTTGDSVGTVSWWFTWGSQLVIQLGQSAGDSFGTVSRWFSLDSKLVIQLGQSASDSDGTCIWVTQDIPLLHWVFSFHGHTSSTRNLGFSISKKKKRSVVWYLMSGQRCQSCQGEASLIHSSKTNRLVIYSTQFSKLETLVNTGQNTSIKSQAKVKLSQYKSSMGCCCWSLLYSTILCSRADSLFSWT